MRFEWFRMCLKQTMGVGRDIALLGEVRGEVFTKYHYPTKKLCLSYGDVTQISSEGTNHNIIALKLENIGQTFSKLLPYPSFPLINSNGQQETNFKA